MGAITGLLGIGGKGANPQLAPIVDPVNQIGLGQAGQGTQNALGQQQQLLSALQGQNGIGNQSSVYNQLQGVANGTGPNPAQAMLAQSTGQNVANQASLAAGQRGAAGNVGLMARQAAQQGSNAQQQAAGQAATMQANQSLNALGQLGSLAGQQVGQQIGATGQLAGSNLENQNQVLGAQGAFNSAQVGNQGSVNAGNASQAGSYAPGQAGVLGGVGQFASSVGSLFADGGDVSLGVPQIAAPNAALAGVSAGAQAAQPSGPRSSLGKFLKGMASPDQPNQQGQLSQGQQVANGIGDLGRGIASLFHAQGGEVKAVVSPGERYLSPKEVKKVEKGANPMKAGEKIPGQPKVGGAVNSYANDTVPRTLEEGGIVLPRSVTMAKDPARAASDFVSKTLAKKKVRN